MCLSYFYTPPFEFKQFQTIVSTLSWSAVWPAFTGLLIIFASTKLRAKLPVPPAGDLLIVYQALASLSAKTWQKIANLNTSIALYIDIMLGHLHLWSLSVSRRLSKQLTLDTPGTVMIVMLAALLYTFLT